MKVYCPMCGQPLTITEIFRQREDLGHIQGDCDNCNKRYHWIKTIKNVIGFSDITYQRIRERKET